MAILMSKDERDLLALLSEARQRGREDNAEFKFMARLPVGPDVKDALYRTNVDIWVQLGAFVDRIIAEREKRRLGPPLSGELAQVLLVVADPQGFGYARAEQMPKRLPHLKPHEIQFRLDQLGQWGLVQSEGYSWALTEEGATEVRKIREAQDEAGDR